MKSRLMIFSLQIPSTLRICPRAWNWNMPSKDRLKLLKKGRKIEVAKGWGGGNEEALQVIWWHCSWLYQAVRKESTQVLSIRLQPWGPFKGGIVTQSTPRIFGCNIYICFPPNWIEPILLKSRACPVKHLISTFYQAKYSSVLSPWLSVTSKTLWCIQVLRDPCGLSL